MRWLIFIFPQKNYAVVLIRIASGGNRVHVRLVMKRSQFRSLSCQAIFFHGNWLLNFFHSNSLLSADLGGSVSGERICISSV